MMTRPDLDLVPSYYMRYVDHVKDLDVLEALRYAGNLTQEIVKQIPEAKGEYRYAPGKWSIKEVLCHMMDVERIFAYRALRFARNDKTPLSGFEENDYAPEANAHSRSIAVIGGELARLRQVNIDMYESFTAEMLKRSGMANRVEVSVLNLGYIMAGHDLHHRKVLHERYLN
jgi:uncharacterized damage-inducible protein DinB